MTPHGWRNHGDDTEAYERMMSGKARFRVVLTIGRQPGEARPHQELHRIAYPEV
jgi:hypothetical protein